MPFLLEEVTTEKEFDAIYPMLYAAFGDPYNSLRQWFIPVHTTVEAAIDDAKARAVKSWKQHANLTWLKVTDTDSGTVVGAAEWEVRDKIDGVGEPQKPINAYWHREGSEEKEFCGKLLTSLKGFMKERMTRPHLELEQLVVHPDYRRRGIAKLLVDWGVKKADRFGLESCVESVPFAVPVYEKLGFVNADSLLPDVGTENPSEKWKQYAAEDLSVRLVWRPAGHNFRAGEDKVPWLDV